MAVAEHTFPTKKGRRLGEYKKNAVFAKVFDFIKACGSPITENEKILVGKLFNCLFKENKKDLITIFKSIM